MRKRKEMCAKGNEGGVKMKVKDRQRKRKFEGNTKIKRIEKRMNSFYRKEIKKNVHKGNIEI